MSGALGQGDLLDAHEPVLVTDLPDDVTSVSCGHFHSIAVTSSGEVWTWGRNNEGQLGHDSSPSDFNPLVCDTPRPVSSKLLRGVQIEQTTASGVVTFAVDAEGQAYSWGASKRGQLGLGSGVTESKTPQKIATNDLPIKKIACGWGHAVGIANTESGELLSWGYPVEGRLGYGYSEIQTMQAQTTSSGSPSGASSSYPLENATAEEEEAVAACVWQPKEVARLSGIRIVGASCGADHTVVTTEWGAAFAFGDNSMNQLGTGPCTSEDLADMLHLSEEYAGGGLQRLDSLGSNAASDVIQSVLFPTPVKVESIACGHAHTLALVKQCKLEEALDGHRSTTTTAFDEVNCVYSWGWDSADQLGHDGGSGGVRTGLPTYVQMFQGTGADVVLDPIKVAAGRVHSVILTEGSQVYIWGSSKNGRLGYDLSEVTTPVPQKLYIPEELEVSRVLDVACGYDHTLLLVE